MPPPSRVRLPLLMTLFGLGGLEGPEAVAGERARADSRPDTRSSSSPQSAVFAPRPSLQVDNFPASRGKRPHITKRLKATNDGRLPPNAKKRQIEMISRRGAPFIICGATRSRTVPQRRSNPRSNLTTPKQGSMQGARKRALRGLLFFPSLLLEKGKIGARNVFHASLPIRLVRHSCESNKTKTVRGCGQTTPNCCSLRLSRNHQLLRVVLAAHIRPSVRSQQERPRDREGQFTQGGEQTFQNKMGNPSNGPATKKWF